MGFKEVTTAEEQKVHWIIDDPASKTETELFWKRLRHFYRTGEKANDNQQDHLSAALSGLLKDSVSNYPYQIHPGLAMDLDENTPFHMLQHILTEHQKDNRKNFKSQLSSIIIGLNELLNIEDRFSEANELKNTYDFADEMIAFDKMVNIVPHGAHVELSKERLMRLKEVVTTLQNGLSYFDREIATVLVDKALKNDIVAHHFFENTQLIESSNDVFAQARQLFADHINLFTELIKAYRIAKLEVEDSYQEEIHDEYFSYFSWHRLTDQELTLFHPLVIITDNHQVFDYLSSFSKLLASNQPINVIVYNNEMVSVANREVSWEDASHQYRQELAALAISHRNAYTFQSGMTDAEVLFIGLESCLRSTAPGVCHIFIPKGDIEYFQSSITANAGRYFPNITYDPNSHSTWNGRFDSSKNTQSDSNWPQLTLSAQTKDGMEAMIDVCFTYADYKANYAEKAQELMIIPSKFYTEHLLPLSDYMELDAERLYGKIPYIWLVDDQKRLHRAAVPNLWVVSCQERLDFWNFIREFGDKHQPQKENPDKLDFDNHHIIREEERAKVVAEYEEKIVRIKEDAIGVAASKLISALLNEEPLEALPISKNTVQTKEIQIPTTKEAIKETPPTAKKSVNKTPWVESENCTSCNECTDKYPGLFKYNDEKLAIINDATKGTFAEFVKAAESCPAACIHPGLPVNNSEKNLDKLIKRAEKFK